MEETLEYWQKCLAEFQEALESEHSMEDVNSVMIKLLKSDIEYCENKIKELSND